MVVHPLFISACSQNTLVECSNEEHKTAEYENQITVMEWDFFNLDFISVHEHYSQKKKKNRNRNKNKKTLRAQVCRVLWSMEYTTLKQSSQKQLNKSIMCASFFYYKVMMYIVLYYGPYHIVRPQ